MGGFWTPPAVWRSGFRWVQAKFKNHTGRAGHRFLLHILPRISRAAVTTTTPYPVLIMRRYLSLSKRNSTALETLSEKPQDHDTETSTVAADDTVVRILRNIQER